MDPGGGIEAFLPPMGDPAGQPADGEHDREHVDRNPQRPQDDARIEIHIGIESAALEIVVGQGLGLQLQGQFHQRIMDTGLKEQFVGSFFEHLGPRVEILVDPVAKAHEAPFLALDLLQERLDLAASVADLHEHVDDGGVGPAVEPPPQGTDAGRHAGEQIGLGGAYHAHGGTGAVLFMVSVDHEKQRQRGYGGLQGFEVPVGEREHHVQEIAAIGEVGVREHERQAEGFAVAEGGNGAYLAHEFGHGHGKLVHVQNFQQVRMVVAQGIDDRRKDRHGLPARGKAVEMMQQSFVEQLLLREQIAKVRPFLGGGKLTENEQHRGFDKGTVLGQLLDGNAAIA